MPRFTFGPSVDADLDEIIEYLEQRNLTAAENFRHAVVDSIRFLSAWPNAGSLQRARQRDGLSVRKWQVKGFPSYLIFYWPIKDGIHVALIVHGARNFNSILRSRLP